MSYGNGNGQLFWAIVLMVVIGLTMIRKGRKALRQPGRTRFWSDSTGLWLTERLFGRQEREQLEERIRAEERIRRMGKQGIVFGVWTLLGAMILLGLHVLGLL